MKRRLPLLVGALLASVLWYRSCGTDELEIPLSSPQPIAEQTIPDNPVQTPSLDLESDIDYERTSNSDASLDRTEPIDEEHEDDFAKAKKGILNCLEKNVPPFEKTCHAYQLEGEVVRGKVEVVHGIRSHRGEAVVATQQELDDGSRRLNDRIADLWVLDEELALMIIESTGTYGKKLSIEQVGEIRTNQSLLTCKGFRSEDRLPLFLKSVERAYRDRPHSEVFDVLKLDDKKLAQVQECIKEHSVSYAYMLERAKLKTLEGDEIGEYIKSARGALEELDSFDEILRDRTEYVGEWDGDPFTGLDMLRSDNRNKATEEEIAWVNSQRDRCLGDLVGLYDSPEATAVLREYDPTGADRFKALERRIADNPDELGLLIGYIENITQNEDGDEELIYLARQSLSSFVDSPNSDRFDPAYIDLANDILADFEN
jgi:hypothetical protein